MTLRIAIAIATAGRREVLSDTVGHLLGQTRPADELLICPARPSDLDAACLLGHPGRPSVLHGPVGLPAQRNVLLDACTADVLIFFDDDFLPCDDYVAEVEALFSSRPEVAMATGKLLADDILGPGLRHDQGLRILERAGPNLEAFSTTATYNGYGCNMAVRMAAVRRHRVRFDEHLPLYAWLEDLDFSRQLVPHGEIVRFARLRGVHLGTKGAGRSPGRRLGYSQIANPIYLARKGTMRWSLARSHMARNLVANSARSLAPEAWVDRRGRLRGNVVALWDWVRGRVDPRRILEF
ncbi:MAG TPA: glycosyltransferase [Variovorax sp.]|nr:glycosyltransferase [Variovorax sp.]